MTSQPGAAAVTTYYYYCWCYAAAVTSRLLFCPAAACCWSLYKVLRFLWFKAFFADWSFFSVGARESFSHTDFKMVTQFGPFLFFWCFAHSFVFVFLFRLLASIFPSMSRSFNTHEVHFIVCLLTAIHFGKSYGRAPLIFCIGRVVKP